MKRIFIVLILSWIIAHGFCQSTIALEDIYKNYAFSDRYIPGFKFQIDGRSYTRLINNQIVSFDITTGKQTSILVNGTALRGKAGFNGRISSYEFSDDEDIILIKSESEKIYRYSSRAHYYLYHRETNDFYKLYTGDKQMYATVSPDGERAAFVVNNNLYIRHLPSGDIEQITSDGQYNHVINGATDWVYEEEFQMSRAFEWSPDGSKLAFLRFDETDVPEFTMMTYSDELYPQYVTFKYPKVGEKNAVVSVFIYDVKKGKKTKAKLPDEELYIPRINWTSSSSELCVTTLNRHQNHLRLWLVNAKKGKRELLLDEKNKYYVDLHDNLTFLPDGKHYLWTSEKNGYNQIFLYDIKGKKEVNLTPGNYDVTAVYGMDIANEVVYYQAAEESPLRRSVFKVGLNGKDREKLTRTQGWNSAQFSDTYEYFVATHSTLNSPPTYRVVDRTGKAIRDIELNEGTREKMTQHDVQPMEFFEFSNSAGDNLNGYLLKPRDFDSSRKYPLFMYQYGGPNSQKAVDRWQGNYFWWFQLLADHGFIVAVVDGRGTGARGEEFRKMTYMQLGHYETIDQIDAARHLGALDFIDADRIGIFGWSYGGYLSSLCLFKGNDVFKMGIAVAPVTNWKWYDTIYTERFMRTENENPSGYRDNSPIYFADRLKGDYLLVHGVADDNVHVQNSMEMTNALVQANKHFDVYFYPNSNHSIAYGNARYHLFTKMTEFIQETLGE